LILKAGVQSSTVWVASEMAFPSLDFSFSPIFECKKITTKLKTTKTVRPVYFKVATRRKPCSVFKIMYQLPGTRHFAYINVLI
jgi:hypothetical protein